MPPVIVEIRTLRYTKTNDILASTPQQISNGPNGNDDDDDVYAAPLDVGTINNKNMLDMDQWDDDASQVTVATKNSLDKSRRRQKGPTKTKTRRKRNKTQETVWQTSSRKYRGK